MPIRPENKARYPKDWYQISLRIRQRADNRCQECGVENHQLGGRLSNGKWLRAMSIGTGRGARGLEWPSEGEWSWCSDGVRTEELRIVKIVLTEGVEDDEEEQAA